MLSILGCLVLRRKVDLIEDEEDEKHELQAQEKADEDI